MNTILLIHSVLAVSIYFFMQKINKILSPRVSTFTVNLLLIVFNVLVLILIPICLGEILRVSLGENEEQSEQEQLLILAPHILSFSMNLYNLFIATNKQLGNESQIVSEEIF
ncbi:ACR3 family arsenite efflux pump ArsB [Arcicella sp. BE140]|uniref:hypothetical protein n=2 Tax=Arcicella TaxID=217140 RepID=UPI0028591E66|nr:hypothetical protein [Arcicella sp. BE140]MDR6564235.1 ACR3 family arsenite efflux pump ArsB [Arcicella sp. BE51]MDR6811518.1 ACR3 family arsenite efflux pump ArsB [Arcicella sp. BE140]MDR6823044.1 ACR3 family arsenite efflux pump ArsB [Arcicella sp. BE139]